MEPNNGIKTWQWVVSAIIVLIVIILIGTMFWGGNGDEAGISPSPDPTASVGANTSGTPSIVLSDQFPGNVVYASIVTLPNGGFVVIHKDNSGRPGAVIGSQYFEAGTRPGNINLTEKTIEGNTYYAMLHSDDGDKKFDATKDAALTNANGAEIAESFIATTDLPGK